MELLKTTDFRPPINLSIDVAEEKLVKILSAYSTVLLGD